MIVREMPHPGFERHGARGAFRLCECPQLASQIVSHIWEGCMGSRRTGSVEFFRTAKIISRPIGTPCPKGWDQPVFIISPSAKLRQHLLKYGPSFCSQCPLSYEKRSKRKDSPAPGALTLLQLG